MYLTVILHVLDTEMESPTNVSFECHSFHAGQSVGDNMHQ